MHLSRRSLALAVALTTAAIPTAAQALLNTSPLAPPELLAELPDPLGTCDPIDPAHCLLPYPSDFFTVADESTDTGRRIHISPLATPRNTLGKPINPKIFAGNDGFSPGSAVLTHVPGLDLGATWGDPDDHLTEPGREFAPDSPIVIIDTVTGQRHPFWSELDTATARAFERDADRRLLILRPMVNFTEGRRYVVALRNLRDSAGSVIPAPKAFAHLRDGTSPALPNPTLAARAPTTERVLADLAAAGIDRHGLYLAWDFTVASERNLTERVLTMRDDAFAQLGDVDLADGIVPADSVPPAFDITEVTEFDPSQNRATARRVQGTITVPNYLTLQLSLDRLDTQVAADALDPIFDRLDEIEGTFGAVEDVVDLALENSGQMLPTTRLNTIGSHDGLPVQNRLQPTVDVDFTCELPHTATAAEPATPSLYGHGLLGSRGEVQGSSTEDLRLRNFAMCAVDWWGMSNRDIVTVATILADTSNFPALADRAQQGFVNFLYLARALAHPDGLTARPEFADAGGAPLVDHSGLVYDGNSQGGIMGGALVALSPDLTRAKLGVPGMNYSTLLNRSVDWEGSYAEISYAFYPSKLEQQLVFQLMQTLWDRAEANGYAHHMTDHPISYPDGSPATPPHQVMLQAAFNDHQVANVSAEVEGRTIGARLRIPTTQASGPATHWAVDPLFGFQPAVYDAASAGQSVLIYWTSTDRDSATPPNGNQPATAGSDPHGDPRKTNIASDQVAVFLRSGVLVDVCTPADSEPEPCLTNNSAQAN